ncbi:protein NEDD1 isoform X1 [Sinocyclocheilus anshuiensis]|uniref:protein NEDD1 isoform X1 n=1 Tax=Sinocyclocheilus anshuiensis TaxID=1608454 RepID=UPI0007BA5AA7|nr:PREDICTED: protein NEDD1 isoform X1 [Sinocyclocheilus anshuiensis]XP_016313025.1 PREDICTED: protein NEDD1 isoform X1 [Sinocyclocheilus anshuiensis]
MEDVTRLVSSGDCLKIWDSTSMTVLEQFNPHSATHPVAQVCWSSSNQYLVSASSIGDKLVVSSLKSSPVPVMELGEGKKQTRVSLNSTSQFLVSGGLDNTVNIWDLKTKRLHRSLKDHKEEVTCVSFNGGDSYIASGSTSGEIILHSITTNLSSKPFGHGPNVPIHDLRYSLVKRSLLGTVSDSGSVALWDANTQKELHLFEGTHKAPCSGLAFSPANDLLFITVGLDKKIVCYDTSSKMVFRNKQVESPLTAIDFTPDGAGLVVGSTQGRIYMYDLRNLSAPVKITTAHKTSVTCIRFQNSTSKLKSTKTSSKSSQSSKRISVKLGGQQTGPSTSTSTVPPGVPGSEFPGDGQAQVTGTAGEVFTREAEGQHSQDQLPNMEKLSNIGRNSLNLDIFSPLNDGFKTHGFSDTPTPRNGGSIDVFSREGEGQHSTDRFRVGRNSLDIFSPVRDDYKGHRLSDVSSGKKDFEYLPHFAGGSSQRKTPLGTPGSRCYSPSVVQTPPPIKEEESITTPPQQTDVEKNNGLRQEYDVTSTPPAAQSTHVQSVNTYNTPEPGQRRDLPTQLTYDSPVSRAPPAAAPAPAAAVESGAEGRGAPLTSIQMNFVRNMIHEALEDFRDTCHRDIINLQVEMVRQFYIQLNEIHGLIEKYSVNDSLIEEIERLREENKRLRANY